MTEWQYLAGFGNEFESEALEGALPKGQNNPQSLKYGLYAEQISGSAFTAKDNVRSWFYRIQPSVTHSSYRALKKGLFGADTQNRAPSPEQMRWNPITIPTEETTFLDGLVTLLENGDVASQSGCAIHLYAANRSMNHTAFVSADGDFLIVPQVGGIRLTTEFGVMDVNPGEISVIQRGMKFKVDLLHESARGYICENYGEHFRLPYRGPIGANGLANQRDFLTPVARFENLSNSYKVVTKFNNNLWEYDMDHSPFNVVAWHGNYVPYKYDLSLFNTMNTVSYDHPDPSIFTVLTSSTSVEGRANLDFVIFPPRWMVAEKTFRPPYYHLNIMSEYMGLIHGSYDAKPADGFLPGGGSLHNCMTAHGPDAQAFASGTAASLAPEKYENTMAFMFESCMAFRQTDYALHGECRQKNYLDCWQGLKNQFHQGQ